MHALLHRAHDAAIAHDFRYFLRRSFGTLSPSETFIQSWHIEAITEYLRALEQSHITRLIINMPPRSLKSMTVTVAWTSYLLGRNPATKIITASYASALSLKHGLDARTLLLSPWFARAFPHTRLISTEKRKLMTTQQGFRLSTSVGGTLTGEGGDVLIIDDPLNPAQAASDRFRARANPWFDHTLASRLNNKHTGRMLLVMQRLHEEDLTGHLLAKGGWEHVALPAMAESPVTISVGRFYKVMQTGELLQPERESEATLARLREDVGSQAFAAQYLQTPVRTEGQMIRAGWIHCAPMPSQVEFLLQSWDTAIKTGAAHDRSACVTLGVSEGRYYVMDALACRMDYPSLKRALLEQVERYKPHAVVIEDKASGQSLLQDVRREHQALPIVPWMPKGNKIQRTARITPLMEAGRICFPYQASWKEEMVAELMAFPHGRHDDLVDALAQGILWLQEREQGKGVIRQL
jgi:predicted phage terminase large subunit-like protein